MSVIRTVGSLSFRVLSDFAKCMYEFVLFKISVGKQSLCLLSFVYTCTCSSCDRERVRTAPSFGNHIFLFFISENNFL